MEPSTSISCHIASSISNEQFVSEHIFIHILTGSLLVYDGRKEYDIQPGDYCLIRRNHLARYSKRAPKNGQFKSVSVHLNQDFLKSFSNEYTWAYTGESANKDSILKLDPNPLLENYVRSLTPYLDLAGTERNDFLAIKMKEIMFILLKSNPGLQNVLFDFSEPGKIDLEAFMNRNFRFNVSLKRFGYLTGRSLSSFKRDFNKVFHDSPGRWLLTKRLQDAHFLIEKKGRKPSEVYLEVGFEDLSHFSYAFKKKYGLSPRQLRRINE